MDWKSDVWWRNRPLAERLDFLHIPLRIRKEGIELDESLSCLGNLLIQGPAGSGKSTHAAKLLYNTIANEKMSGRWIEADDYIDMIKDSFDNNGLLPEMYSTPHLVKYVKGVFDQVVLDGLGEERLTEFAAHELGSLIRKRYDRNLPTIITSSLSLPDIKNRYGNRLATALADFDVEPMTRRR